VWHVYCIFNGRVACSRQRANDASRDKPCLDDDLDAITFTQIPKHRKSINICRKHHEIYIHTMSLPYTISLAKSRYLDGTPVGFDTRMASYLKHSGPWVLVLLLLHPLHWNKDSVLRLIHLTAKRLSSLTDHTYKQGTTLYSETCCRGHLRVYVSQISGDISPKICRTCQSKTFRLSNPTYSRRYCRKTLSSLGARWRKISYRICLTKRTPTRAKVS